MKPVRRTDGKPRRVGRCAFQSARSFLVLPACVVPFTAELRATERCRAQAEILTRMPRRYRLRLLPYLWTLRRLSLERRLGEKAARRCAWSLIWVILWTPRVLSKPVKTPDGKSVNAHLLRQRHARKATP